MAAGPESNGEEASVLTYQHVDIPLALCFHGDSLSSKFGAHIPSCLRE